MLSYKAFPKVSSARNGLRSKKANPKDGDSLETIKLVRQTNEDMGGNFLTDDCRIKSTLKCNETCAYRRSVVEVGVGSFLTPIGYEPAPYSSPLISIIEL